MLSAAEVLLRDLGVTAPSEIDLEAIAYHLGADVRYAPLRGCEARIIGDKSRAIITVNDKSVTVRQRFSIAHELGHWTLHRGRRLVCSGQGLNDRQATQTERAADRFAAEMLMPAYLFRPLVDAQLRPSWNFVRDIAGDFRASPLACARRLVELGTHRMALVCHGTNGMRWFVRSPALDNAWFLRDEIPSESSAMNVLYGHQADDPHPRRVSSSSWFARTGSNSHVWEQTARSGQEVLTFILLA